MDIKILKSIIAIILVISIGVVFAHEHDFTEVKQLIDSGINCSELTNEQLEKIGDYYMEQMHPGESHEYMDKMMGGEGSESLKQVHINIAKSIYCGESSSMMEMMGGNMMGNNMMGGGMMGNYDYQNPQNNRIYQNSFFWFQILFYIITTLLIIILILVIILLIKKSKNNTKGKRRQEHGK